MPLPLLILFPVLLGAPQPPSCDDAASCRAAAVEAAGAGDFELSHDLAWRAVQRGRRNDPELMLLLARAQSLSGRPGDALVMLRRLTEMGVVTDARESDDFARVRALPGWGELEPMIAALAEGRPSAPTRAGAAAPASPGGTASADATAASAGATAASVGAPGTTPAPAAAPAAPPAVPPAAGRAAPGAPASAPPPLRGGENTIRLTATAIQPIGLAYDSVSRRFLLGDRRANKVVIADEVFNHINDLIGAAAAGFGGLTAMAIDTRRGDLWVTSSGPSGGASLHKLQLVSGRVLATTELGEELHPLVLSDLAVTEAGTLLLADSAGARLLVMRAAAGRPERPTVIRTPAPWSVAPAPGEVAYVAHEDGLTRVELPAGRVTHVRAASGVGLAGIRRLRWHRGTLVAIQQDGGGEGRLVRLRLNAAGSTVTAVEPLDEHPGTDTGALTISRDAAYFVARAEGEPVIRKVELR